MTSRTPLPAAVILPWRRTAPEAASSLEFLWLRRSPGQHYQAGYWAFPGGRVEESDASRQVAGASGEEAVRIACAARELEEETGLVVPADATRFRLCGRATSPEFASFRFDASYFLVEIERDAELAALSRRGGPTRLGRMEGRRGSAAALPIDDKEHAEAEWVSPAEALRRWAAGERLASHVVVAAVRALLDGPDPDRVGREVHAAVSAALWEIVPGIEMCPVKTPTLPPATHTNCYVVGGKELVVVDPGSPYEDQQALLDGALDRLALAGRSVREIWITHHHGDHMGGAAHLAKRLGVKVAAHPECARRIADRVTVERLLHDDEVAVLPGLGDVPERRLRAVFTPGHSPGHHCYYEETTGMLLCGDMVAGVGTIVVSPPEGDMSEYLASLDRMKSLSPRALLPAHGPILAEPLARLDEYTRHRLWREDKVLAALTERKVASARDLVPDVYDDVPQALYPLAEQSLLAHLIKLARDGRAVEESGGKYTVAPG